MGLRETSGAPPKSGLPAFLWLPLPLGEGWGEGRGPTSEVRKQGSIGPREPGDDPHPRPLSQEERGGRQAPMLESVGASVVSSLTLTTLASVKMSATLSRLPGSRTLADRFYCPDSPVNGRVLLEGDEARHLIRVRRVARGECVEIFDGRGSAIRAEVADLGRDRVELVVLGPAVSIREPRCLLTLATAVPKGERFDWLVEKATELGVARLTPIVTERSVVDPRSAKLDRLRRVDRRGLQTMSTRPFDGSRLAHGLVNRGRAGSTTRPTDCTPGRRRDCRDGIASRRSARHPGHRT